MGSKWHRMDLATEFLCTLFAYIFEERAPSDIHGDGTGERGDEGLARTGRQDEVGRGQESVVTGPGWRVRRRM